MSKGLKGSLLIVVSTVMFGSYGVFSKYLSDYDIFYQTYVRCFIVTLVLTVWGIYKKQFRKIDKEDWGWFSIVLIFTSFSIAPIVYAFNHLPIGTASFLFYASLTIFTYILGFLFFNEKLGKIKLISLILSFIGMFFIFALEFSLALIVPMGLAVLNGIASSGEITFSKKISEKYSSVQITTSVFLFIAITHMFISLALGEKQDITFITSNSYILAGFVLVAITGMITVIVGFKYVEPSIGALVGLLEIVFSVIFGYLFFHEILSLNAILGGILILISAGLPNFMELTKKS